MWVYVIDTFRYNYTCVFTVVIVWLIKLYAMLGDGKIVEVERQVKSSQVNPFCQASAQAEAKGPNMF